MMLLPCMTLLIWCLLQNGKKFKTYKPSEKLKWNNVGECVTKEHKNYQIKKFYRNCKFVNYAGNNKKLIALRLLHFQVFHTIG